MEKKLRREDRLPIKVLVIDDSPLVRNILSLGLGMDENIEVLGAAPDPYVARDMIVQLKPDVLTLDVEMPKMNGVEFLKRLMPQHPMPVVMVSALTLKGKKITIEALEAGAVDFVSKPSTNLSHGLNSMLRELREKIKMASRANISESGYRRREPEKYAGNKKPAENLPAGTVVAIGASTGGTQAIKTLLTELPEDSPGIVIVQHMPPGFTKIFSDRLNEQCGVRVKEAENGDLISQGSVLVAPGGFHMSVGNSPKGFYVTCKKGEPVNGHCPSVDVLMNSVAKCVGADAVGVMLTGMGRDGAEGMFSMHEAGAVNLAQDKSSSIVFGMPHEAEKRGGVDHVMPLNKIASAIMNHILVKKS